MQQLKHKVQTEQSGESIKAILLEALCVNEHEYFQMVFRTGLNYLAQQVNYKGWDMEQIQHEAFFWNWFKSEWQQRDAEFYHIYNEAIADAVIDSGDGGTTYATKLRTLYYIHHETCINLPAMHRRYEELISNAIKEDMVTGTDDG